MIPLFKPHMPKSVDKPLLEVLHSGYITQGAKVDEFEHKLAEFLEVPFVATVNSGTSALTLALRLAGVTNGDEVITTAMTCTATNLAILANGGRPRFVDIDPTTGNISPREVEKVISPFTKAIMAVDWGGTPVDVESLMKIARRYGIKVIVDAAHGFGNTHNAQPDFTCYSFQAIKHLTTIDGGALVCRSRVDFERAKILRWFGIDRNMPSTDTRIDQDIDEWGYKFHMNDVSATIGIEQLNYTHAIVGAHQSNALFYNEELDDYFEVPEYNTNSAYWLYTILLPTEAERDAFKEWMIDHGIQVSQVHKRNDEYSVFTPYQGDYMAGMDSFSSRMICIPVHWALTLNERQYIADAANGFARSAS